MLSFPCDIASETYRVSERIEIIIIFFFLMVKSHSYGNEFAEVLSRNHYQFNTNSKYC